MTFLFDFLLKIGEWILGILALVGGFLLSYKAVLALLYYSFNLIKMGRNALLKIWHRFRKVPLSPSFPKEFWGKRHRFEKTMSNLSQAKMEEFRHWLISLLEEGVLHEKDFSKIPLYEYFKKYELLTRSEQKEELGKELASWVKNFFKSPQI